MSDEFIMHPLVCFKDGVECEDTYLHTVGVKQGSTYALRYTIDQTTYNNNTSLSFSKSSETEFTDIQWEG